MERKTGKVLSLHGIVSKGLNRAGENVSPDRTFLITVRRGRIGYHYFPLPCC